MLTEVLMMMKETILRGQQSANDLKTVLSENQATLIVSDPRVAALVDNLFDHFTQLSSLIFSDSSSTSTHHDLNSNHDNNMLVRSSAKGKEVTFLIVHKTDESPDSFSWRKYGQKHTKDSTRLRRYYKCSKCEAKKWVQVIEDNPLMSTTYYKGVHTCEAVVSSNHVNEEESSFNMSQFQSQIKTMSNSFLPSLPQTGFEFPFPPYGDEGLLPLEDNVYQGTVIANNAMDQVYGNQILCSESTFQAYGDSMHPLKDINVGQETVVANTVHQNYGFESSFLPYGDEGFLPLKDNVYQRTAVANNVMNQVYGDQFLRSESTFQAYGGSMTPLKDKVGQETVVANSTVHQNYGFPSLPQVGHQETDVANTVHENYGFESPIHDLPYGDEGFLPLEDNVYQGTVIANSAMNQFYDDPFFDLWRL